MPREDRLYLSHVLDAAERIEGYIAGLDLVAFLDDPLRQDGVIRQLGIVGEAVKHLSQDLRASTPDVLWGDIAGMRDRLVHDYMGVDLEAVWKTATRGCPEAKNGGPGTPRYKLRITTGLRLRPSDGGLRPNWPKGRMGSGSERVVSRRAAPGSGLGGASSETAKRSSDMTRAR
jgi:uncharacterized protein with HEPN domain